MKLSKSARKILFVLGVVAVVLAAASVYSWTQRRAAESENDAKMRAGWGNSGELRPDYTADEIAAGVLSDEIVFNSVTDGVIGNEKNCVGAREATGTNLGQANVWQDDLITVEDGKEYLIRMYVRNDNPNEEAVATGTRVAFSMPNTSATQAAIGGYIFSDNSRYDTYWDSVVIEAEQPFHLEYAAGSALLENNGIGADGGYALSDDIVYKAASEHGVAIGYNELDGRLPGGYQYAAYVTIRVRVVFD